MELSPASNPVAQISDLKLFNTLVIVNNQITDAHSFRLYKEYKDVISRLNITVLDINSIGMLEWVYVTPIFFDESGEMFIGAENIRPLLDAMRTPLSAPAPNPGPAENPEPESKPQRQSRWKDKDGNIIQKNPSKPNNSDVIERASEMLAARKKAMEDPRK